MTFDARWAPSSDRDDGRCPFGILVALGATIVVGATAAAAGLAGTPGPRLGLLVVAVGVFGATTDDPLAALVTGAVAWPVGNGFLVDRLGELHWHGRLDGWFVCSLLAAVAAGAVAAQVRQYLTGRRRWRPAAKALVPAPGPAPAPVRY